MWQAACNLRPAACDMSSVQVGMVLDDKTIDDGCCAFVYRPSSIVAIPDRSQGAELERFEVFDQIVDLALAQSEREKAIVVVDDISQRGEAAVMVEAARLVRPETFEGRCAIALIGGAVGLEVVDADLGAGMHVPT